LLLCEKASTNLKREWKNTAAGKEGRFAGRMPRVGGEEKEDAR